MGSVLRIMLDTNVYGLIIEKEDPEEMIVKIAGSGLLICGSTVIRAELRDTPKAKVSGKRKLRLRLLSSYDSLVSDKRNYGANEIIRKIAGEYNEHYKGSHSLNELKNDFLIVATASLHGLDIVVSEDEKTMKSPLALEAYTNLNKKYDLMSPHFIGFGQFKELL